MARAPRSCGPRAPLLLVAAMLAVWGAASGQLRYSIPEEMKKGSFVGNVALDLGMDPRELSEGGARIVSRGRKQHFTLHENTGRLLTNERIDREDLCAEIIPCLLGLEIIVQRKMKVYSVEIEIQDINDNSPAFLNNQIVLQVSELEPPGARFTLPEAHDLDVGGNSIQGYDLSPNKHFTLEVKTGADGVKYPELVLEQSLDREEQDTHQLTLTAVDGGDPARSGTAQIRVNVLDSNDNTPVFNQSVYKISILENVPNGTVVTTITATDRDQGANAELTYSFSKITDKVLQTFRLDFKTGEISVIKSLDFEEIKHYEFEVQATDGQRLSRCKVLVEVINVNDNGPEILFSSLINQISENSPRGTAFALLEVYDRDAGEYGEVTCSIPHHLPFHLEKSYGSYYSLVTDSSLDREQVSEYNITIIASDKGNPPLSKSKTIHLQISDENDNAPLFDQLSYTAYVMENTPAGASIFRAKATDRDWDQNGKITYSIAGGLIDDQPLTSYVSINSESGIIYALQSFDFEEFREFQIPIKAKDGGSPTLTSNVTVVFVILDQNDNTPEILYPSAPTDGSSGVEMAPRSSEPGYQITKVVAVDGDSGQNAWLSYQLLRATDQGLFTVGLHTGEIRTGRPIMEKDAIKNFLVVSVRDNGQPPLSASVTVTIVLADSLPEVVADLGTFPSSLADSDSDITLYLVIAVSVVSFMFLFFVILLLALRLREWRESLLLKSSGGNLNTLHSTQFVGVDGVRAFLQTYAPGVYLTNESRKSPIIFPASHIAQHVMGNRSSEEQPSIPVEDLLTGGIEDQTFTQQAQPFQQSQPFQQAPPNTDWRFSQAQRPGTSGSQNSEEAGGWPNNQFETERLQAMILASANEGADGSSTLGGGAGTMGLSTRYGPQFTLQHVPDYRQNVYIPGSTATLTNAAGKRDGKSAAASGGNKKKSGKKEKK
ncbi:protocadherin gamma-A6-like isoform X27 [Ambystoma mexicanum]|uniref:protocadherin gamma-A6-like isoform X27 n=1 Tax=Ambystoma mexicanum TaxID=8296 RepID=UPI0037E7E9BA